MQSVEISDGKLSASSERDSKYSPTQSSLFDVYHLDHNRAATS